MGQIKAYRCDVCKKIQEDALPFTYEGLDGENAKRELRISLGAPGPEQQGACCSACLLEVAKRWSNAPRPAENGRSTKNGGE